MSTHQSNVSMTGVQHLEYHMHLTTIVILLSRKILCLIVTVDPTAYMKYTIINIGSCSLSQVRSLMENNTPVLVKPLSFATQKLLNPSIPYWAKNWLIIIWKSINSKSYLCQQKVKKKNTVISIVRHLSCFTEISTENTSKAPEIQVNKIGTISSF